ncbi:MAG: CarD family transcriptional regulator [Acidaminococcaceae bacterium]|jgi:CarD family transcriptional regulator|nr:CarD family transcriptional regulator [Acidaminococcaceae bacterium]MCI2109435.1 CarD family transcriptional regulator [Acidaminococcaceae bacterium]
MFSIGDKVVYPMHGGGIIKEIEKRKVQGISVDYFVVQMLLENMKVMIPAENLEKVGVRHIVNKKALTKVEQVLKDRPENKMKQITWNRRFNLYIDKMKTGDIYAVADVVRTLAVQGIEKKLSTGERRLLITAKHILLSEVMLVQSVDEEKSEEWLSKFV